MQSTWFVVFIMKMLLMWLLVANLFFEVLIHKRTTRFLLVRILYSLMLIIPLLLIVGIVVVVKLIRFNIFIMYCKNNLHSNNFFCILLYFNQNIANQCWRRKSKRRRKHRRWLWGGRWLNGSQKENTDLDDDWSSNIYVFKFGEGYYSFQIDVLICFILFCRRFTIFFIALCTF